MSAESTLTKEAVELAASIAEAHGFIVVRGDAWTLLLDLDTEQQRAQYEAVMPHFEQNYAVEEIESWPSKSGNRHTRLKLYTPISEPAMRYALQAALGSDPVKELLSIVRLRNGVPEPSMLFKPGLAKVLYVTPSDVDQLEDLFS